MHQIQLNFIKLVLLLYRMKKLVLFVCILVAHHVYAQYPIGNRSITLVDSSRSNRNIPLEIYYPAEMAGTNTFPALGVYPLITLGHGFVMGVDAYYNFKDTLVPQGYVIVLVNTETSLSPVHLEFAKDLVFVNQYIKQKAATDPSFFLYPFLNGKSCITGHSMGGGSAFLAGSLALPGEVDCIAGFAPAETSPSAIEASTTFDLPLIVFSGSADGVTPPAQHHIPMYDSSASSCKFFVDIIGGAHCYFANTNIACDFGEALSSPGISITREEHQAITFRFLEPWLRHYLKNDVNGLSELQTGLQSSATTNYQASCTSIGIEEQGNWSLFVQWAIVNRSLQITCLHTLKNASLSFSIQNLTGQQMIKKQAALKPGESATTSLDTLSSGLYILKLQMGSQSQCFKFNLQ
jgi:hypothetical protein